MGWPWLKFKNKETRQMNGQAPYAKWREELNQVLEAVRRGEVAGTAHESAYLATMQVRLLLEQVELLDRIGNALDALAAARYGG